ncbi:hypothetical protein DMA12_21160 [Amycolatopsis balhimycina DSM 5908]|jgi:hypothetical protein|uniref:Uncharacterized protein n=1 Tax=Amycolatopsis balhimycina DSM 5908 TaxID=1081091 RepID=A0A428WI27_AMYBA|nr:radical SAM-modified peptide, FtsH ternary system-associated [Amycolatopsis balhimycina]RSM42731.1 hypothetical protein DMA12_21160 [Amycolatopsis balhimycina DSM 5908]
MTDHAFVPDLPDLIDAGEYERYPKGELVRVRISRTENGVEILGDGLRPEVVEKLLAALGPEVIQQMLCG